MVKPYYILKFYFLICCFLSSVNVNAQSMKFFHITSKDGLSQNSAYAICMDYRGFMWIGTRDGLNKYDGYTITQYKHSKKDSTSLSNNFIRVIFSDSKNRLWIGTSNGGLELYNFVLDNFTHFAGNNGDQPQISGNNISTIKEDNQGNLWIGTIDAGLFMFNPDKNIVKSYQHSDSIENSISSNSVRALCIDRDGYIWLGFWTPGGLNRFDPKTGEIIKYTSLNSGISSDYVREIYIDRNNVLWIGTDGGGMDKFNPATHSFKVFKHNEKPSNSISLNVVSRIIEGFDGELWIGTENGGLNIFDPKSEQFTNYSNSPSDATSISNNSIYSLYKVENTIWIGTYSGGPNVFFKDNNLFTHVKNNILNPNSLSNNSVLCFSEDNNGNIWIGTDGGGLNKYEPKKNKYTHYRYNPDNPNSLPSDYVVDILFASDNKLWLGTWGGGLTIFDPTNNSFKQVFSNYSTEIKSKYRNSWSLVEDSKGIIWDGSFYGGLVALNKNGEIIYKFEAKSDGSELSQNDIDYLAIDPSQKYLWIGTDANGLNRLNLSDFTFTYFNNDPNRPNSLVNNNIVCLFFDSSNLLWIGTSNGLSCLNTSTGNFKNYTVENGLTNDFITSIVEDNNKLIWVSTKRGVSRLNPATGLIDNFDIHQGLQDYEFNRGASIKLKNGTIFFGGINGFNIFNPSDIKEASPNPPIFLTEFYLHNTPSKKFGIKTHPNELKEVRLNYRQNYLTFEYAALAYSISNKIEYEYTLNGVDADWVYVHKKRSATYTNLPPGKYEFWVRTIYNNSIREPVKLITITIVPPFWKTVPFIVLVILLIATSIVLFIQYRERRLIREKNTLEKLVAERTFSIEKQKTELEILNKTKDKLFSIIAHDLRNPFNTLLGFSELMSMRIEQWNKQKINETVNLINDSARRIYNLLENLLAWAQSQNASINFKPVRLKLLPVVDENLDLFATLTHSKKITTECIIDKDFELYADIDMLNTILRNLICNAIKFSCAEGRITISASKIDNKSVIEVSDAGIGIEDGKADLIFSNAFETTMGTENEKGTGLGLFICHEFMMKHNGKIYYKSQPGIGTTFYLEFPDLYPLVN
jgi:ligand-binding sensor domain-containing protein/signal transduction histidine kinase